MVTDVKTFENNANTSGDEKEVGKLEYELRGKVTGKHDPLTGRIQKQPISIHNKYSMLAEEFSFDSSSSSVTGIPVYQIQRKISTNRKV